jgi:hypothetical protein
MKNGKSIGLLVALALGATFATDIAAQSSHESQAAPSGNGNVNAADGTARNLPDMRLWSFGDCDNKFPFVNSDEHKECVRVVGSEEARDARAYRVCETSNPRDPEEVARCKSTYKTNKDRSAQSGYVPNAVPQTQAVPSAEELQRVKAIASAAVEHDKSVKTAAAATAAEAPEPGPTPEPEEESGPSTLVIALSIVAALLGTAAFVARRRQTNAFLVR